MSLIRSLQQGLQLVFLVVMSVILSVLTVVHTLVILLRKGPKRMFTRTKRDTEPTCLTDPSLGTHGYLHLEEVRIHYVSNGSQEKPLMLLLHGFPEFWYSYRHQLREFANDYRVVAIDQRGYGDSSQPSGIEEYKLERMVKDTKQIITALGYSSCVLVGHDWGGAVAWSFSGCYPDMVEKVVVLNCPHARSFKKYIRTHWAQFKKSWYMFFFLMPILPELYIGLSDLRFFDIIFRGKKGGVLTEATTSEDVEAYKYMFQKWGSLTGPINYIRASLLYPMSPRLSQKITKPVLLIWGCRDLALETGQAEWCQEFAYDLEIKYLEKASHWVQMDEPEKVNTYIRQFLSKEKNTRKSSSV